MAINKVDQALNNVMQTDKNDQNNNRKPFGFCINGLDEEYLAKAMTAVLLSKALSSSSTWVKWIHLAALEDLLGNPVPPLTADGLKALQENDKEFINNKGNKSSEEKEKKIEIKTKDVKIQCTPSIMGIVESVGIQKSLRKAKMVNEEIQTDDGSDKLLFSLDCATQTSDDMTMTKNKDTQTILVYKESKAVQVGKTSLCHLSPSEDSSPNNSSMESRPPYIEEVLQASSKEDLDWYLYPIDDLKPSKVVLQTHKREGDIELFHGRPLIKKYNVSPHFIPLNCRDSPLENFIFDPRLGKNDPIQILDLGHALKDIFL